MIEKWILEVRMPGLEFQTSNFDSCIIQITEVNMGKGIIEELIYFSKIPPSIKLGRGINKFIGELGRFMVECI